jgi:3,4-dihydroxy 2-butanone 4-phosphate synthase
VEGKGELGGEIGMMRRDSCLRFARRFGLCCVSIEGLAKYLNEGGKGKSKS